MARHLICCHRFLLPRIIVEVARTPCLAHRPRHECRLPIEAGIALDIEESGTTFAANAVLKAEGLRASAMGSSWPTIRAW
jgi:hypothetical protein